MRVVLSVLAILVLLNSCAQDSVAPVAVPATDALAEPMICTISIQNIGHRLKRLSYTRSPVDVYYSIDDTIHACWQYSRNDVQGSLSGHTFTARYGNEEISLVLSEDYKEIETVHIVYQEYRNDYDGSSVIIHSNSYTFIAGHITMTEQNEQNRRYRIEGAGVIDKVNELRFSDEQDEYYGNGGQYSHTDYYKLLPPLSATAESSITIELTPQNLWQQASARTMRYDTR